MNNYPETREQVRRENTIIEVMEKTGWSYDHAVAQLEDARKRLNISYLGYLFNGFYALSHEEQAEKYKEVVKRLKEQKESCLAATARETGCSLREAENVVNEARSRLGISYRDYEAFEFFRLSPEEQKTKYREIQKQRASENPERDRETPAMKRAVIKTVMERTGWSWSEAVTKIVDAKRRTNCMYKEYQIYKFYDLDEATQNDMFLIDMSRKVVEKYDVDNKYFLLLCNKEKTNKRFSAYMRRPWCVNTKISYWNFRRKFAKCQRLIYKPVRGCKGNGVQAFDITPKTARAVFKQLSALPEGVVEQYVKQHPAMSSLSPSSVNTIRVVTISSNTHPVTADGKMLDIAYAALRIGGSNALVDNFHSGGMAAGVDLETGELVTNAADMDGNVYEVHPATGTKIKGFRIPYFAEALEMVKKACEDSGVTGFLGWDIAIAEDGPMLIEINLRPGVVLLTAPFAAEKKGMKHVMEKYL